MALCVSHEDRAVLHIWPLGYRVVVVHAFQVGRRWLPRQPATRDYVARRTAEGKTSREIKRCLARYVARDLYRLLENPATAA